MTLDYRNKVSIAVIAFYIPILFLAIFLLARQGIHRNAGYVYMVMFSIARILGGAMEVATVNYPDNKSLYIGYAILVSIGLSPLLLSALGIIGRVLSSIERTKKLLFNEFYLYGIHLIIIVALILSIVGIDSLPSGAIFDGHYSQPKLSIASAALFIVSYVLILAVTLYLALNFSHARTEEKRLLIALLISMPLLLVRLIFTCIATLGNVHSFNAFTGDVTIFLCVALIEEYLTVFTYEAFAITVGPFPKDRPTARGQNALSSDEEMGKTSGNPQEKQSSGAGATLKKIARYTIIGNIVLAIQNRKK